MYKDMTYESILDDMLGRVPDDIDKREGSVIYDALAPAAYKLAENYFKLDNFIDLVFADTAVGSYLDRITADVDVQRRPATKALRKIETNIPVEIGTRWGIEDLIYIVTERISDTSYKAKCATFGTTGNLYSGKLDNLDNVNGVTAYLTDILTAGTDTEQDEALRARYYQKVREPATSGNRYHYKQWALEVPGVGNVRVFELFDGPGTVLLLIVDTNMEIEPTLESRVLAHIEEQRPIGAEVTVQSPDAKTIEITADIVLDGSKTFEAVQIDFELLVADMLKESVFNTASISYAKIGGVLLSTPGVEDYANLQVNDSTANITIAETEIPVLGTVILSEV